MLSASTKNLHPPEAEAQTAQPTSPPPNEGPGPDRFENISEDAVIDDEPTGPITEAAEYAEVNRDRGLSNEDHGGARITLEQDQAFAEAEPAQQPAHEPESAEPARPRMIRSVKLEPLAQPVPATLPELPEPETGMSTTSSGLSLSQTNDPNQLLRWGNIIFESKAFPLLKTPQEAVVRILMARSLKIDEMQAMYMLHVIDSKPVLSADLTRFLLDRAGVRYKVVHDHALYVNPNSGANDYLTKVRMVQGPKEAPTKDVTWELWYSECAPFIKTNGVTWGKFTRMMHLHACVRQCARFYFPAILGGMYDPEELGLDAETTFAAEA